MEALRQRLRERHWLRLHIVLIALATLALLGGLGASLRALGVDSLGLRWALALPLAYFGYLALLRLWAQMLIDREGPDLGDTVDLGNVANAACDIGTSAEGAGEAAGGVLEAAGEALGAADEGAIVLVPLALLVGVVLLLAGLFGVGVFALFGSEVLLAVLAEVLAASLAGAVAYKGRREGWLEAAFARTWRGALAAWGLVLLLGLALDHWLPQADSFPQAVRLLLG